MKRALFTLLVSLSVMTAVAEEITPEQSQVAVEAWMRKYGSITGKSVRRIETITDQATGAQFHVAVLRGGGFVVTAADDRVLPVMAYSETGTFINAPDNPLLQILQSDASAAKEAFGEEDSSSTSGATRGRARLAVSATGAAQERTDAQREWDELLGRTAGQESIKRGTRSLQTTGSTRSATSRTETRVKPLLKDKTTGQELLWSQLTHNDQKDFDGGSGLLCYNYYTPEWPVANASQVTAHNGEADNLNTNDTRLSTHYPCGCVATAGAMIMKKWEHPGKYSFKVMPANPRKRPTPEGRRAIGEVTRAIGNACDATYGPETSMSTSTMVKKLKSFFSYMGAFWQNLNASAFTASNGDTCTFDNQVLPNLIAGCPVSMSLVGHSVVADGLQYVGATRKIHVNFGWLIESANVWYTPPTFTVKYTTYEDGRAVTKTKTYNSVQGIGINIHPEQKKAIIAGRVAYYFDNDDIGVGLKGVSVVLTKGGGFVASSQTDAYGQFHFLVDGGTYELEVSKSGYETKTISNITVSCTDETVSNYYTDISLLKTTATPVETPDIVATGYNSGEYYSIQMSCATDGATIHYTVDGSNPTEDDSVYFGQFVQHGQGTMTMKARAFKEGMLPSGVCSVDLPFKPLSANTKFSTAAILASVEGKTAMNNASATKESGEPVHSVMGKAGGASMWASFTAPEDGDYTFTVSGVSAEDEDNALDTQLAIYTGDSINALTLVAANDDVDAAGYDLSSKVAFHANAGTTYKIAVDTRNGAKGTINLEWKPGREDVASPTEYDGYYTAERNTYSIPVRSTATWCVCDGSDWISVKKSSGNDGESLTFELPEMTEEGTRSGILLLCAGEDGPCSTIRITQGTTSWVTSRADALAMAKAKGKRILMVCGRDTCSNTSYTRFTACEDASVKPLLLEGYVLWYCNCDEQWEDYSYYTSGLGGYTLPLVCIIDPIDPEKYVTRTTGKLTAATLGQLLRENSEGDLPTAPFEVAARSDDSTGTIAISYAPARRAQSYEIWRGEKWDPAEAVRIASDVLTEEYVDESAEPSVLYYYRVRAVNGVGVGEMSAPVTGCWRVSGAQGDAAIGNALGAPHLDWVTEGDYPWTVQGTNTYDGAGAMQSAFVDPKQGGVTSVLKTTVTGPTRMSFRYKTRMYSSRFTITVDGVEAFLVTGTVGDWTLAEVEIPEGGHEVAFSYTKSGYYSSGFNGVYLDTVQFDVLSVPPTLTPATTDDEDTALSFTGSMTVYISAPEGGDIFYTTDGSEPTRLSSRYDGPFQIDVSSRVRAMCVQNGYDCSRTVSGLYLERHPVQAGEWTTDVEGAKKAAVKDGSIIVTLLGNYETCGYTRSFAAVAESAEFLSWARANGVYLITADSSRWIDANAAYYRFVDLFYDAGQGGSIYYPSLAIANAWDPDAATGFAVARSGQSIGSVQYDGTVATLEAGLASFFATRPSVSFVWVEFDGNGGTPYEKSMVGIAGQAIGELPRASRSYHYFDGWYTSAEGGAEVTAETVLSADTVCFAHWTPYSYRVQFNANGGTVSTSYKYVSYGMTYGDLPIPVRTDSSNIYTFDGWYTAATGGTEVTSTTEVAITSAQTLYAHWTSTPRETYVITYDPGANGTGAPQTATKTQGVALTLKGAIFTRTGYTQTGWTTADGGAKTFDLSSTYAVDSPMTLYPFWTANTYSVTLNKQNGTGGTASVTATYGSAMPAISVPSRTGYTFGGYYSSTGGGGTQYYTAAGASARTWDNSAATTLYAKWTANTYTVTLNRQSGSGGTASVTAAYGSAMPAITVPTRAGYTFGGYWTAANGGGTQYYTAAGASARTWNKTAAATLYAKWTANTCAVTFDRQSGTGGSASVTATYGSAMPAITVPTRTGYTFGGYYSSTGGGGTQYYTASGASARTWDKTAATTLYAKWTGNTYAVTLNRQSGTGGTASVTATYGSAMPAISVPTRTGYAFDGYWTAANGGGTQYYTAAGASARTWDKTAATTLYAKWTENRAPVFETISPAVAFEAMEVGATEDFSVTTSDPDGDAVTVKWYIVEEANQNRMLAGSGNGYTFTATTAGNFRIEAEASDGIASVTCQWDVKVLSADVTAYGELPGSGLVWSVSGTTLTISGNGPMPDYADADPPYQGCAGTVTAIVVEEGVTRVGDNAFQDFQGVESVSLPETLTSIGIGAFADCASLDNVVISDSVETLGEGVFSGCAAMEMLYLPQRFVPYVDDLGIPDTCSVANTDVYHFVRRLYNLCLGREPEWSGCATWSKRLTSGEKNGAMAAFGFCLSAEMERRNLSNAEYVEVLYRAIMGRAPDSNGKAYWVNLLDNGVSRRGVFRGFAESAEFTRICGDYGIVRGSVDPSKLEERDKNRGVTMFVARCYTKALNRNYDVKGLNSWCAKINSSSTKKATAIQVAKSFLNSKEFKNRNLSNSAYVDVLYQTFFDRNPDTNGKKKWLSQLNSGVGRDKVMASFYNSAEFTTIMASYGIK